MNRYLENIMSILSSTRNPNPMYQKSRTLILLLLTSIGCQSREGVFKENFVSLCRNSKGDSLRVFYLDQNGISKIAVEEQDDSTIVLTIAVSPTSLQKAFYVRVDSAIKVVNYGNRKRYFHLLATCGNPKSGKEALEYLRGLDK